MRVSETMHEVTGLQSTDPGQDAGEKAVARDVEGDSQSHVATPLVHLTTEFSIRAHIELAQQVTGGQGHLGEVGRLFVRRNTAYQKSRDVRTTEPSEKRERKKKEKRVDIIHSRQT